MHPFHFRLLLTLLWCAVLFLLGGTLGRAESPGETSLPSPDLQSISRSVFRVFAMDSRSRSLATGSGFFIQEKGLLLTNYHVVEGRDSFAIFVVNPAGDNAVLLDAVPLAFDKEHDLALLHVEGDSLPAPFRLCDKDPHLLQKVIAIGFPGGVDSLSPAPHKRSLVDRLAGGIDNLIPNVTQGSISKITADTIVHDCKIGPGSSGGPLLDAASGEVVGVNFAGRTDQAYVTFFFAIPAHTIRSFLAGESGYRLSAGPRSSHNHPSPQAGSSSAPVLNDAFVSSIVEEHVGGGTNSRPINADIYEDVLFYGADLKPMPLRDYLNDSLLYFRNWPLRAYEILSVSKNEYNISVIFSFKCRSRRGKLSHGFSRLCLSLSQNFRIAAIIEETFPVLPDDFPSFSPVTYSGPRFFLAE